jgi:hypothetical protein
MPVAVKTRHTNIAFNAPAVVLKEIKARYALYIVENEESVDITETDWYRDMETRMKPGDYLRAVREAQGKTLREVGELVGATPQHVHDWEAGLRGIGKEKAKVLAGFFKLPVERLI